MGKLINLIAKEIVVGVGINVLATKVIPKLADKAKAKLEKWKKETQETESGDIEADDIISVDAEDLNKKVEIYTAKWQ